MHKKLKILYKFLLNEKANITYIKLHSTKKKNYNILYLRIKISRNRASSMKYFQNDSPSKKKEKKTFFKNEFYLLRKHNIIIRILALIFFISIHQIKYRFKNRILILYKVKNRS